MGYPSVTRVDENTTRYTELRANANELLKYVSFASAKDLEEARTGLSSYTAKNVSSNVLNATNREYLVQQQLDINELFLSDVEPTPLYNEMARLKPGFNYSGAYNPFSGSPDKLLSNKTISLVYHDANKASSLSSVLTDISALFCSIIPSTEMSLCVPYFDMKIIYPWTETSDYPRLDLLKFVGADTKTSLGRSNANERDTKFGYDEVGMELFGVPQTLAPTSEFFKTSEAYAQRGIDVLDPISPLLTLSSVNIEQIGVGGGLNIQSKINLSLTLHDRSRLSDIEPLVSSSIFPFITFRITYGWHHPDTNKMSSNIYSKFLNSMRVTQDFSVVSVSVTSKSGPSLGINITLSGAGTQISKSAKIISASNVYVPYSAVDSLIRQFITLKSKRSSKSRTADTESVEFERVGSTVISSMSSAVSRNKFVSVESFYNLYNRLRTGVKTEEDLKEISKTMTELFADPKKSEIQNSLIQEFSQIFSFELSNKSRYGQFVDSVLNSEIDSNRPFITEELDNFVMKIAQESGYHNITTFIESSDPEDIKALSRTAPEGSEGSTPTSDPAASAINESEAASEDTSKLSPEEQANQKRILAEIDAQIAQTKKDQNNGGTLLATIVPLSEMISHLVAKPLLISQPDLKEVRIHAFCFNSACGRFAEESIGNFPIVKSKFINHLDEKNKELGISANTTVDTVISLLTQHVNDPSSPFYGFSSIFETARKGAEFIKESLKDDPDALQQDLDKINKGAEKEIDELNKKYLEEKNITLTDTSFVPPRVKIGLEILPAYENESEREKPTSKIARIIIYDERCGGFDKLGNLLFSMINSNGLARVGGDGRVNAVIPGGATTIDKVVNLFKTIEGAGENGTNADLSMISLKNKKLIREISSNLYPSLVVGSEGSLISEASYSSAPSGDIQSSYLLTALQEQNGSVTGASSESPLIDDVFVLPANVRLNMLGNTCIARGQTYYVDFHTGTTLDNSYTVTSVSHTLRPGSFTTSATLMPTNSASIKSVQRQSQELFQKIKNTYKILGPT